MEISISRYFVLSLSVNSLLGDIHDGYEYFAVGPQQLKELTSFECNQTEQSYKQQIRYSEPEEIQKDDPRMRGRRLRTYGALD